MNNDDYDLIIRYPASISSKLADEIERSGQLITHNLKIVKYTPQPMAYTALDAIISFSIVVTGGLFSGFLQELGAEGARSLRKNLGDLITKVKRLNRRKVTQEDLKKYYKLSKRADKMDKKELKSQLDDIGIPSPPLAIRIQITSYYIVEFIFPDDITPKETQRALSTIRKKLDLHLLFAEALPELNNKYGCDLLRKLASSQSERVYIYMNEEWITQTHKQIIESEHKRRKSQHRIPSKSKSKSKK